MSNKELVDIYLKSLAFLSLDTKNSKKNFLYAVAREINESFLSLTSAGIKDYIVKKKELNQWRSASTICEYITRLKAFYKFLVDEKYIKEEDNPVKNIKRPRYGSISDVKPFSQDEIKRLLKTVESPIVELDEKLIFYLVLFTGVRAKELCSIKKENIDLEKGLIYLNKEDTKGKLRARLVPVASKRALELLKLYLIKNPTSSEYLFETIKGKRLYRAGVHTVFKNIIDYAYPYKGTWNKPHGPHQARHTFASRWIESGGNIHALRAIMGWTSFAQLDRYVDVSPQFIQDSALKIEKKLSKVN